MTRKNLYGLCKQWGEWSASMDGCGFSGIAPYAKANIGEHGAGVTEGRVYRFPSKRISDVDKIINALPGDDKALIQAHFKCGMSYAKIGELTSKTKSWAQKRINQILRKIG